MKITKLSADGSQSLTVSPTLFARVKKLIVALLNIVNYMVIKKDVAGFILQKKSKGWGTS